MNTERNNLPLLGKVVLMALLGMAVVFCRSKNLGKATTIDVSQQKTDAISVSEKAEFDAFLGKFHDILAKSDVMQSALTKEVDELCCSLTPNLLAQLLHFAAQGPPVSIEPSNWLLGYNQLMATASNKFGEKAASEFYQLAANPEAYPVLRDYASQHYFRTQQKFLSAMNPASDSDAIQERLDQIMKQAEALVRSTDPNAGTMPGASLLGLVAVTERFTKYPAHYDRLKGSIEALTTPILQNWETSSNSTRNAALQAAARLRINTCAEVAWKVATDPDAEVIDRIGAIGALRQFPERVDEKALIASCRNDERLQNAARRLLNPP